MTLTLNDGNTAPGDFDENNLTLGLDGINSGLKLSGFGQVGDGFGGFHTVNTLTITSTPADIQNNAAALAMILSALQADGQLVGTVIDRTPGDNLVAFPIDAVTTLSITGDGVMNPTVGSPEPATLLTASLATVAGFVAARRRRGR